MTWLPRALPFLLLALTTTACGGSDDGSQEAATGPGASLDSWTRARPGEDVPVTVRFPGPTPDSAVIAYLQDHSLEPYAVFVHPDGSLGVVRGTPAEASVELVGTAREQSASDLTMAMCGQMNRAWAMLDRDTTDLAGLRALLSHFYRLREALPRLVEGGPIVYAVQAVGAPDDVRSALSDPRATVQMAAAPGGKGPGEAPPPAPPDTAEGPTPEVAAMSRAQVVAAARELGQRDLERCLTQKGSGGPQG